MKITHYRVVTADNTKDLEDEIVPYLEQGYQPQGDLNIIVKPSGLVIYCQVMVM